MSSAHSDLIPDHIVAMSCTHAPFSTIRNHSTKVKGDVCSEFIPEQRIYHVLVIARVSLKGWATFHVCMLIMTADSFSHFGVDVS